MAIYLDKRSTVNGKVSHINMSNFLNLTDYITTLVNSTISAENGLTDTAGVITLGGALTSATTITGAFALNLENSILNVDQNGNGEVIISNDNTKVNLSTTQAGDTSFMSIAKTDYEAFVGVQDVNNLGALTATMYHYNTATDVYSVVGCVNDSLTAGIIDNVNSVSSILINTISTSTLAVTDSIASSYASVNLDITANATLQIFDGTNGSSFEAVLDDGKGSPGLTVTGLGTYADDAAAGLAGVNSGNLFILAGTGALTVKA